MGFKSRLKNALKKSVKVTSALGGNWAAVKKINALDKAEANATAESANALSAASSAAASARTAEEQAALDAENTYRSGLSGNKSGLASTILNLGGAAGDPSNPSASGLLGSLNDTAPLADSIARLKRQRQLGL